VQQRRIRGALVEGNEGDVGDAREAFERATDLTAGVESERAGAQLIHDHHDGRRPGQTPQLGMIAQEPADAERIRRGDGDDRVGFGEDGGGRRVPPGSCEVVGGFVIGVEGS
jgi:hypothetical protein